MKKWKKENVVECQLKSASIGKQKKVNLIQKQKNKRKITLLFSTSMSLSLRLPSPFSCSLTSSLTHWSPPRNLPLTSPFLLPPHLEDWGARGEIPSLGTWTRHSKHEHLSEAAVEALLAGHREARGRLILHGAVSGRVRLAWRGQTKSKIMDRHLTLSWLRSSARPHLPPPPLCFVFALELLPLLQDK